MTSLSGKVALVTGASRGIGRALALKLAAEGAHIIATARTVGGLEEVDDDIRKLGGAATLVPLNITDFEGIDRLGAAIHERWQKLDILIGNAGVLGKITPITHLDPSVWTEVMSVNVTANWRLIRSMDPLLRQAEAARAVFLTSGAAVKLHAYWGAYSISKAALEGLVKTYAAETVTTPIRANLLSPGPIRTKMRAAAMPGEDPETLPTPEMLAEAALPLLLPGLAETGRVYNYQRETGKLVAAR